MSNKDRQDIYDESVDTDNHEYNNYDFDEEGLQFDEDYDDTGEDYSDEDDEYLMNYGSNIQSKKNGKQGDDDDNYANIDSIMQQSSKARGSDGQNVGGNGENLPATVNTFHHAMRPKIRKKGDPHYGEKLNDPDEEKRKKEEKEKSAKKNKKNEKNSHIITSSETRGLVATRIEPVQKEKKKIVVPSTKDKMKEAKDFFGRIDWSSPSTIALILLVVVIIASIGLFFYSEHVKKIQEETFRNMPSQTDSISVPGIRDIEGNIRSVGGTDAGNIVDSIKEKVQSGADALNTENLPDSMQGVVSKAQDAVDEAKATMDEEMEKMDFSEDKAPRLQDIGKDKQ